MASTLQKEEPTFTEPQIDGEPAETPAETPAEAPAEAPAEDPAEAPVGAEAPAEAPVEAQVPAGAPTEPKRRGRPKATSAVTAAPKAVAPKRAVRLKLPSSHVSSAEDDTPLSRDDMETMLLDYLVTGKRNQQNARRAMWAQLAGLS